MKKLLMLAVAAMALAIPAASASANPEFEFLHEKEPVTETTEVTFTGTVGFEGAAGAVHCPQSDITLDLFPNGEGEVTNFDCINGLLNGTFPVDDTATNTHEWGVTIIGENHIEISGVEIHNTYTHPTLGVCVGSSTAAGTVTAKFVGDPEDSSTVELYTDTENEFTNGGGSVSVFGHLQSENTNKETTSIGIS